MTTMFYIWLAAAVVFLIIELMTPTLIFICFVAAAVVAGIVAQFWPEATSWQVGIFALLSIVLIPLTRRFAKRITKPPPELSNIDRMIGQAAMVTKAIDPDLGGQVKFEGELWQAKAATKIEENAKVRINAVSGTRVIVEEID